MVVVGVVVVHVVGVLYGRRDSVFQVSKKVVPPYLDHLAVLDLGRLAYPLILNEDCCFLIGRSNPGHAPR